MTHKSAPKREWVIPLGNKEMVFQFGHCGPIESGHFGPTSILRCPEVIYGVNLARLSLATVAKLNSKVFGRLEWTNVAQSNGCVILSQRAA